MRLVDALVCLGACPEAQEWLAAQPPVADVREHWGACPRGDWLLWLAARARVDRRVLVAAACACARLALPYATRASVAHSLDTTDAWCRGEATIAEVLAARDAIDSLAARDAIGSYDVADAAAHAADAANSAANAAADAAASAAHAYANAYANAAAYAAAAAADAAHANADAAERAAYAAAHASMHARCADTVRGVILWADVDRGLYAVVTR